TGDRRAHRADDLQWGIAGRRVDSPTEDPSGRAPGRGFHGCRAREHRLVVQRLQRSVLLRILRRAEHRHRAPDPDAPATPAGQGFRAGALGPWRVASGLFESYYLIFF